MRKKGSEGKKKMKPKKMKMIMMMIKLLYKVTYYTHRR